MGSWNKFSGYGFVSRHDENQLTNKRIHLRLHMDPYQPVLKVNTKKDGKTEEVKRYTYKLASFGIETMKLVMIVHHNMTRYLRIIQLNSVLSIDFPLYF